MINSIAGNGITAQAQTTRSSGSSETVDDGFASTLSAVGQTPAAASATTAAAASSVLGSANWFSLMFASPAEEQAFATDLTQRLQSSGIDTSAPIALTVDRSGHVKAKEGTPGSEAINALFASDPTLENTYKKIANTEETTALVRTEAAYSAAYGAAGNDAVRGAVWQQYSGTFNAIAANDGNLTLADGRLT